MPFVTSQRATVKNQHCMKDADGREIYEQRKAVLKNSKCSFLCNMATIKNKSRNNNAYYKASCCQGAVNGPAHWQE